VEVQTELAAPAIQTWGFIKAGGTLRVFYYIYIILIQIDDDIDDRNNNERADIYFEFCGPSDRFWSFIFCVAARLEE
jgi:hypothetical protein